MNTKRRARTFKDLLIHSALIVATLLVILLLFFYGVLPWITHQDEIVTVPDLTGMTLDEAIVSLKQKDLAYEVLADSGYTTEEDPQTVLEQYPRAPAHVKVYRKINLTLNARRPPKVVFPALHNATYDFARRQLLALGFKIGSIHYRPDIAYNAVLEASAEGKIIQTGEQVYKGMAIDLIIGASTEGKFSLPDFRGRKYSEAERMLLELDLTAGEVHREAGLQDGTVRKQNPAPGDSVKRLDEVELWLQ